MGDRYAGEELGGTDIEYTGCKLELFRIFKDCSEVVVFTYFALVACELVTLVDIVLVELLFGYGVLSVTVLVEFMLAAIELSIEVTNLVDVV